MKRFLILCGIVLMGYGVGNCYIYPNVTPRDSDGDAINFNSDGSLNLNMTSGLNMNGYYIYTSSSIRANEFIGGGSGLTDVDAETLGGISSTTFATDTEVATATTSAVVPYVTKVLLNSTTDIIKLDIAVATTSAVTPYLPLAGGTMTGQVATSYAIESSSSVRATTYYGSGADLTGITAKDICVPLYSGDIFDSTTTYNYGLWSAILKDAISIASYQIVVGSETSDAFSIEIGTASASASPIVWYEPAYTIAVTANTSTMTATSAMNLSAGDMIKIGFSGVNSADPAGNILIRIKD